MKAQQKDMLINQVNCTLVFQNKWKESIFYNGRKSEEVLWTPTDNTHENWIKKKLSKDIVYKS